MYVRVRLPAAGRADRLAALRSCRGVLMIFAGSTALMSVALAYVLSGPGMFIDGVHTRLPGLLFAAAIALGAQASAVGVYYRDRLRQERWKRDPRCPSYGVPRGEPVG